MVEHGVYQTEGRTFMGFLNRKLDELRSLVADYSEEEHNRHGFYLRRQLWHMLMCAPIIRRTNLKPRGYAGDSEIMRMIYDNAYRGDSLFARLLHKHALERTGAHAVRNRRVLVADALRSYREETASGQPVRVLSVACGPGRELADIILTQTDAKNFTFRMFDQDQYALMEAAKLVNTIEVRLDTAIRADYVRESVRTMLATRELDAEWGQYDFIYSMGLFDYLTPPVARAVLRKLYGLLSPGGQIIIGNFHVDNPSRIYMEYWLDWKIYHRDQDGMLALARRVAPDAEHTILADETNVQMLLKLKRAV
jgi:SAM-dependent methyltransferase